MPKAADLMQALNLMISDSPQLIFVIGMDREKVAAGLAVKYEKLLPYLLPAPPAADKVGRIMPPAGQPAAASAKGGGDTTGGVDFGYNFIEKFVQLPFRIPEPGEPDLRRLLQMLSPAGRVNERPTTAPTPAPMAAGRDKKDKDKESLSAADAPPTPPIVATDGDAARVHLAPTPDVATTGAPAGDKPPTPAQVERRAIFTLLATGDSETVRDIVLMVAPALDNNPRRLKQFINMFRLKAFIAAETGLNEHLTLQQLGKFVAVSQMWPRLLVDLEDDIMLLAELQRRALDPALARPGDSAAIKRWGARPELTKLLRYGCGGQPDEGPVAPATYSLEQVNVTKLLSVSPVVTRSPAHDGRREQVVEASA